MLRFLILFTVFGALSCATQTPSDPPAPAPPPELTGSWIVTHLGEQEVIEGSQCQLEFHADGKLSGNASVNRVAGSFTLEGDALTFSPLATTKRMGPVPLMKQEQALLDALARTARAARHDDTLTLLDTDGRALLSARTSD
ncbi:MAG: hypothetical protein DHS20C15_13520 [Planctomycetota bacterium]|nr:MAG: hypothetical protein DHS20C15_13520 [Planctomycetota bacterium]